MPAESIRWRRRYPTTWTVLPAAATALAVGLVLLAVPAAPMAGSLAIVAVAVSLLLFAFPTRVAFGIVAVLAAGTTLVGGALWAARAIGAL
jgi:hypothetical protein